MLLRRRAILVLRPEHADDRQRLGHRLNAAVLGKWHNASTSTGVSIARKTAERTFPIPPAGFPSGSLSGPQLAFGGPV